jgi:predicted transcriptional regulator
VAVGVAAQAMLQGMPESRELRRTEVDGQVLITVGATVIAGYQVDDAVMRNITAVALTGLGFSGRRVGELLGITEQYVSMLRGRARRHGSEGLAPRRGRPPALGRGDLAKARRLREQGQSDEEIGRRLGVHATTVGRALPARRPPEAAEEEAVAWATLPLEQAAAEEASVEEVAVAEVAVVPGVGGQDREGGVGPSVAGSARIGTGGGVSRYAGAMLLHAFLHRVDAERVLLAACGQGQGRGRYDDLGLLTGVCLGFALGVSSVEATKHLIRAQVGPLAGLAALPELRTLRPRLASLAALADPLELQRALGAAMLGCDAPALGLYFVDDHFVPYEGAKPVGKGWNTKRRHAQRGRDDTLVADYHGRAVCFASADPAGLSTSLPGALAQLCQVLGPDTPIMLGFDRGGSYPVVFRACREAGAHWLTWRRGALVPTAAAPTRSFRVGPDGHAEAVVLADEISEIKDYGPARQLTLFEAGQPVLQVLTSDTSAPAAALLAWLRCRWRIENAFKYLTAHYGIDWLCDYGAEIGPDTSLVANPARAQARKRLTAAETELAEAERALAQLLGSEQPAAAKNQALPAAQAAITAAQKAVAAAKTERDAHPAKLPANQINPDAKRAQPHLRRRALQMVLRLLAYNGEHWLAQRLNAYLQDPNEYRALTRQLLHQAGEITYTPEAITVTLDPPATPRLTRALRLLLQEINICPPRLPGDHRPITYTIA